MNTRNINRGAQKPKERSDIRLDIGLVLLLLAIVGLLALFFDY